MQAGVLIRGGIDFGDDIGVVAIDAVLRDGIALKTTIINGLIYIGG
jgi:hypothetical protein